jgi:hypothetical protein
LSGHAEIVSDLLQARRAEPSATAIFRDLKHDKDLCPKLRDQIEEIFSALKKYQTIVHDTQGPQDKGTDVLLTEWVEDTKEFNCFQIKAEADFAAKDYLKTLKAQFHDARNTYGSKLKHYYIVVCYSIVSEEESGEVIIDKGRNEKVKNIIREFAREDKVRVIEPGFAAWFLGLSTIQIDVIVRTRFGNDDIVFKEARHLVADLKITEKIVLVFILWLHLYDNKFMVTADEITQSPFIRRMHLLIVEDIDELYEFDYQIAHDLQVLEDKFLESEGDGFSLHIQGVESLAILMLDGSVRYDYHDEGLLEYMLRILSGYDLSEVEDSRYR